MTATSALEDKTQRWF